MIISIFAGYNLQTLIILSRRSDYLNNSINRMVKLVNRVFDRKLKIPFRFNNISTCLANSIMVHA
jgi:hypothetical protein